MLGLFRNDVFTVKKQLIITAVTAVMLIAFGIIFCGSFRYGNLAKLPEEDFNDVFSSMTLLFGPLYAAFLSLSQPFAGTVYISRQSGWYRFVCTTPIKESRVALVRLLETVGFTLFSLIFGFISMISCYGIAGREITSDDIFIMLTGVLIVAFISLLPTSYIVKTRDSETVLMIIFFFALSGAVILGASLYSNGNPARLTHLVEKAADSIPVICLALLVIDIAAFFISWGIATLILKKRKF